jgi:hypothetical protein
MHHTVRRQKGMGLSGNQLRERLNHLQELHILPEHRVQLGLPNDDDQTEAST